MPKIYCKPTHGHQNGYNDNAGGLYKAEGWNYGVKDTRVGLVRFPHVPVPKGSTINSATLHVWFSVKTGTNDYNFATSTWYDSTIMSQWLSTTRDEWNGTGVRSWAKAAGQADKTVTWLKEGQPGYRNRQSTNVNVKPTLDVVVNHSSWTLAGGPLTILMGFGSVSSPDNIYIHRTEDNLPPVLEIDYTPPASDGKDTVVNLQENCNFTGTYPWTGQPAGLENNAPYGFNQWFGAFAQPTYSVAASFGSITAPKGGNVLRVTSSATSPMRSMVHLGVPNLEDGQWYNYSAYVYVPSGSPDIQMVPLGDRAERNASFTTMTEKGQWKRQEFSFIAETNAGEWGCIQQVTGPYAAGQVFYVANVQITKGRQMRPYIDGAQTLTNANYGWAGQAGTGGFVRAVAPTVTVNPIEDTGRRKYYGVSWTYSNSAGHAQAQSEVQVRRAKH